MDPVLSLTLGRNNLTDSATRNCCRPLEFLPFFVRVFRYSVGTK